MALVGSEEIHLGLLPGIFFLSRIIGLAYLGI